jgi:hypothetical protein
MENGSHWVGTWATTPAPSSTDLWVEPAQLIVLPREDNKITDIKRLSGPLSD